VIIGSFGIFLEKFCFRRFAGDFNRIVMICVAIIVILQTAVNIVVGTQILSLPPFAEGTSKIGPVSVGNERIVTFAIGVFLLLVIIWFVNKTKWGQQMQAISQNIQGAFLQGINVHRVSALASFIGCALAAIAGCLIGAYLSLGPFMGNFIRSRQYQRYILCRARPGCPGFYFTHIDKRQYQRCYCYSYSCDSSANTSSGFLRTRNGNVG
jgi:branched-chain amino acid transport system permease protein